jgi:4-amino-4-deoxy-L-arabinose transferase-like glycosyltransferase
LLGSYYFARHTRLAETDIPATLFVTLAIYALWRGSGDRDQTSSRAWIGWMHLGAFAIGMSVMCKGAPGAFPILFLLTYALIERSARPIRRFIVSGAPLTLVLIALSWFIFVGHHEGWETFIFELRNVEAGTDHGAPVYQYIPWIVIGTLPWSVVSIVAILLACREWRDARVRGMLIWLAVITLPLCITANKQSHYLIPELPIVMLLTGWIVDRWNNRPLIGAAIACAVVVPPVVTLLIPRFSNEHTRETAQFVREHFDDSPLCFYGQNESVPLCFNLRRAIPFANDDAELASFIARQPDIVIITIGKDKRPASAPSADQFEHLTSGKWEDQVWDFYRVRK